MFDDKSFLLTDDEGVNIAVISKKDKATPSEFNDAIATAIKDHFGTNEVTINRVEDSMEFDADTVENEEECIRSFTLEEITVY